MMGKHKSRATNGSAAIDRLTSQENWRDVFLKGLGTTKEECKRDCPWTIADIGDFPTPLDEITRHPEQYWDIRANLVRIEQNARRLIADSRIADASYILVDAVRAFWMLEDLATAWKNEDIPAATEAAFHLGAIDQRMTNRRLYDSHIRRGRGQMKALAKGPAKIKADAKREYDRINKAVDARLKKRGRHKQPTITEIRRQVADQLGITKQRVLDAAKGGRK